MASERPGTNVSEPLITTGDSLDKYQTISEKVYLLSAFLVICFYIICREFITCNQCGDYALFLFNNILVKTLFQLENLLANDGKEAEIQV